LGKEGRKKKNWYNIIRKVGEKLASKRRFGGRVMARKIKTKGCIFRMWEVMAVWRMMSGGL